MIPGSVFYADIDAADNYRAMQVMIVLNVIGD